MAFAMTLSVRPRGIIPFPLGELSWKLIFEYFSKICRENSSLLKSDKNNGYFTWRPIYVYTNISLVLLRNVSDTIVEKIKTQSLCSITFSRKSSFIRSVFCLTTGPKPHPKQFLHIVRSRSSSFKWEYPVLSLRSSSSFLRLLPRLLVTSISPFFFPSVTCFRRQFLRKMWQTHTFMR